MSRVTIGIIREFSEGYNLESLVRDLIRYRLVKDIILRI